MSSTSSSATPGSALSSKNVRKATAFETERGLYIHKRRICSSEQSDGKPSRCYEWDRNVVRGYWSPNLREVLYAVKYTRKFMLPLHSMKPAELKNTEHARGLITWGCDTGSIYGHVFSTDAIWPTFEHAKNDVCSKILAWMMLKQIAKDSARVQDPNHVNFIPFAGAGYAHEYHTENPPDDFLDGEPEDAALSSSFQVMSLDPPRVPGQFRDDIFHASFPTTRQHISDYNKRKVVGLDDRHNAFLSPKDVYEAHIESSLLDCLWTSRPGSESSRVQARHASSRRGESTDHKTQSVPGSLRGLVHVSWIGEWHAQIRFLKVVRDGKTISSDCQDAVNLMREAKARLQSTLDKKGPDAIVRLLAEYTEEAYQESTEGDDTSAENPKSMDPTCLTRFEIVSHIGFDPDTTMTSPLAATPHGASTFNTAVGSPPDTTMHGCTPPVHHGNSAAKTNITKTVAPSPQDTKMHRFTPPTHHGNSAANTNITKTAASSAQDTEMRGFTPPFQERKSAANTNITSAQDPGVQQTLPSSQKDSFTANNATTTDQSSIQPRSGNLANAGVVANNYQQMLQPAHTNHQGSLEASTQTAATKQPAALVQPTPGRASPQLNPSSMGINAVSGASSNDVADQANMLQYGRQPPVATPDGTPSVPGPSAIGSQTAQQLNQNRQINDQNPFANLLTPSKPPLLGRTYAKMKKPKDAKKPEDNS